jgi:hypothetical protein
MATKTVVCPECGAGAAPGRFACAECGALLAAVGAFPRRWDAGSPGEDEPTPEAIESAPASDVAGDAEVEALAVPTVAPEAASPAAVAVAEPEAAAEPEPVSNPEPQRAAEPEPSALAAASTPATAASEPSWPERPQPVPASRPLPSVLGLIEPEADRRASSAGEDGFDDEFEDDLDDDAPVAAARAAAAARVWPPEGVPQPGPIPAARTPAGAYLSPSAAPPPDAPTVPSPAPVAATVAPVASSATDARASLSETLGAFGITEDIPHRLIGAGAAIAGLGFLLPWAAVLAGNGLGGSYWSRWGLAGPGHWIIVAGLIGCVVVALAGDRLGRVPIGPIAVVLAAVLIGLLWPYVFGVFERFVGVWLVLGGTLILGIGGILDVRRHEPEEPPV